MVRNYYFDAEALASRIALEGHHDGSRRIREAIEAGATSTEILMRLRHTCCELMATHGLSASTHERLYELVEALDQVLS